MISKNDFPKNFYFGLSSSAFQTEGNHKHDGKGASIWDEFVLEEKKVKQAKYAHAATNFYKHHQQDLDLIQWMNCENFRFSMAWSRLFPEGTGKINLKGVDFYDRLIDKCLARGIQPWVTLYHWDLPLALQQKGGWFNRDCVKWFEDYIAFAVEKYRDRVNHWMVLNEPTAFTGLGYFMGMHAPGKRGMKNFLPAMHHTALAQAAGGRLVKSIDSNFRVGTTLSFSHIEAFKESKRDQLAAKKVDALLNRLFLEPLLGLGYPLDDLPAFRKVEKYMEQGDKEKLQFDFDFIGVQNYSREVIAHSWFTPIVKAKLIPAKKRNVETTAMGWENYPKALYQVLKKLSQYENIPPLVVTETGIALEDKVSSEIKVKDVKRIEFITESLMGVKQAQQEGANVQGYFIWSATDNFEWAEGIKPRFGLIFINYDKQKRVPKDSAFWFKKFLTSKNQTGI